MSKDINEWMLDRYEENQDKFFTVTEVAKGIGADYQETYKKLKGGWLFERFVRNGLKSEYKLNHGAVNTMRLKYSRPLSLKGI